MHGIINVILISLLRGSCMNLQEVGDVLEKMAVHARRSVASV